MQRNEEGDIIFRYLEHLEEDFSHIDLLYDSWCELQTEQQKFRLCHDDGDFWELPIYKDCSIHERNILGGLVYRGDQNDQLSHFEFFFFEGEIYVVHCPQWIVLFQLRSDNPKRDWLWLNQVLTNASEGGM